MFVLFLADWIISGEKNWQKQVRKHRRPILREQVSQVCRSDHDIKYEHKITSNQREKYSFLTIYDCKK